MIGTGSASAGGQRSGAGAASGRRLVAALAVTQTVGYGTLTYAFAVFLVPLAADLHTSTTAVTGACTASVLTAAIMAVPVGRWLDRRGGRALMTIGSLAGTALLVAWSNVDSLAELYAVQIGIGAASAASLYEAAFAVIIAWFSPERRASMLLTVTVVAGFASSIFLPLSGWLVDRYGWRTALLVLAAIQALSAPLHAAVVRGPAHQVARSAEVSIAGRRAGVIRAALSDRGFWLLSLSLTVHIAAISTLTVHLVAALTSLGHPPAFAANVAGLLGLLSVTGRLVTTGLHRRYQISSVTAVFFAVQAAAAALLPVVGVSALGAIGAVLGIGIGFGVATIAKPALVAQRYDTSRYATLAGILAVPMAFAKAAAPLSAAALHTAAGSYTPVLLATAGCCAFAATAVALLGAITHAPPSA